MGDSEVADAFTAVPRAGFLPAGERDRAEKDTALPIGHGQTNSQPTTVRGMLELLDVRPGDRVLDVGSGSGWTTALLAHLTGPSGSVLGVELEPELVDFGAANLAAYGLGWAGIRAAEPEVLGVPAEAPYDRILVSAAAREVPAELVEQLRDASPGADDEGGRMVVPVGGALVVVVRAGGGVTTSRHGAYRFVPLR